MKKILLTILTIGILAFLAYWGTEMYQFAEGVKKDGLSSQNTSTTDSIETKFRYEPEEYYEESIDTIIDSENNLRLKLKRYSLESGFEVPFEFGNTKETVFFRDFAAEIKLLLNDSLITSTKLQKDDFKNKIDDNEFLEMAYLSFVDFDDYNSENQEIKLTIMLVKIESDYAYIFEVTIDKQGESTIALKETR